MPNTLQDMKNAWAALAKFRAHAASPYHERYSFPFLCGSYFAYRKVDVMRLAAIARSASVSLPPSASSSDPAAEGTDNPTYLDVGCGYGDFLRHVRQEIPGAQGLEKDGSMFYGLGIAKPEYIKIADAHWIDSKYDVIFVGWMEPGQDFRDPVARNTDVIVTTLDQGLSLAAEFDGHGFERVAWWRTPSWEDVNTEIMNRHYSASSMLEKTRSALASLRGAHNLWYVYAKPERHDSVQRALRKQVEVEEESLANDDDSSSSRRYDFESVLDECGFGYMERLDSAAGPQEPLWQVNFH